MQALCFGIGALRYGGGVRTKIQVVVRDEIIDVLWGTHPPSSCRSLVPLYVGQLRRLLEPDPPFGVRRLPFPT